MAGHGPGRHDHLIFTNDLDADVAARMALVDIDRLCRALAESGRWEHGRAMRLAKDVGPAGPRSPGCCRRPELA
jgi:hypothetical protein